MFTIEQIIPTVFTAKVRGVAFTVSDIRDLPEVSMRKIVEYGLQRIFNDSASSAKSDDEAIALATKRLDALRGGILRASPIREGNPIRARALEIASAKVKAHPKFIAWCAENGLKVTSKDAAAEIRRQAIVAIDKPDNAFMAQAAKDVAEAKALTIDDLDF